MRVIRLFEKVVTAVGIFPRKKGLCVCVCEREREVRGRLTGVHSLMLLMDHLPLDPRI